jgi:hypothetical protein
MSLKLTEAEFIRELIKVAEIPKWGQLAPVQENPYDATTTPSLTSAQIQAIAQKLAQNLQQSMMGITSPRADAEMYLKDVLDLPSLINFLYKHMIQHNGQYVVSKQAPVAGQEDKSVPYTVEGLAISAPEVEGQLPQAMPGGKEQAYINKDALIGYLQSLQQQANDPKNPNALLSATLTRLIETAETELKIAVPKKSTVTEVPAGGQAIIDDNSPLDSLDATIYVDGPMMPARDQGNIIIRSKMLKSKPEFDNLVKVLQVVKDKKQVPYDDDAIYCYVIGVLYTRAQSYNFRRGEPLDKHYLELITQLASQYQCALPQAGHAGEKSDQYQQAAYHPGQPLNQQQLQALSAISLQYPLRRDMVDFEGIRDWANSYQQVLGTSFKDSSDAPLVANVLDQANGIINGFGVPHQSLSDNAVDIYQDIFNLVSKTKTRQEAAYVPSQYVANIRSLLVSLERLLLSFKKRYYASMPEDWKSNLDQQAGDANSLYSDNERRVAQWISMMPQAMKQVIERGQ